MAVSSILQQVNTGSQLTHYTPQTGNALGLVSRQQMDSSKNGGGTNREKMRQKGVHPGEHRAGVRH